MSTPHIQLILNILFNSLVGLVGTHFFPLPFSAGKNVSSSWAGGSAYSCPRKRGQIQLLLNLSTEQRGV